LAASARHTRPLIAWALIGLGCAPGLAPAQPPPRPFTFATVEHLAALRAQRPYAVHSSALPQALARLSYAQYRSIRFKPQDALWPRATGTMFDVHFYPRGFAFTHAVRIYAVSSAGVHRVRYRPSMFAVPADLARLPRPHNLGFAGLSVRFPLNSPQQRSPVLAFLGGTYFRVLGRNQVPGITARGLSIDTAAVSGEETPYFTDFWLVQPAPRARTLTIYALLESPSVTGAYRFVLTPGTSTRVTVSVVLYPRRNITQLGIAPLTSMFLYGVNSARRRFENWRPQVHDSDGLLMQTGSGEWLWRPLQNPSRLEVNRYMAHDPRGFGLIQRARSFADYEDPVARYEQRPSYWIQPLGHWGYGGVELVEIPATEPIDYNVDAYWVPSAPVRAGQPLAFSYLLSAYLHSGGRWPPGGKAVTTRFGAVVRDMHALRHWRRTVIDFAGGDLSSLRADQPVHAVVTATGARVTAVHVQRLPENGHWRAQFTVHPTGGPVNLRCYLELYGAPLTETWTYQWTP